MLKRSLHAIELKAYKICAMANTPYEGEYMFQ